MTSSNRILESLRQYSSIEETLLKGDDVSSERLYSILREVGKSGGGLSLRDLIEKCRRSEEEVGRNYVIAATKWLIERGYVSKGGERKWSLKSTGKGRKGLLELNKFLNAPRFEGLTYEVDLGFKGSVKVEVESGKMNDSEKHLTLLDQPIESRFIELFNILASYGSKFRGLKISFSMDTPVNPEVQRVAERMWLFYEEVTTREEDRELFPAIYGAEMPSVLRYSKTRRFNEFWGEMRTKIRLARLSRPALSKEGHEAALKRLPKSILDPITENPKIREWVYERLKENPNWFMPSFFWRMLDYEVEAKEGEVSPPFPDYIKIVSPPFGKKLFRFLVELNRANLHLTKRSPGLEAKIYEERFGRKLSNIELAFASLQKYLEEVSGDSDLYRCWTIARKDYEGKLGDVSKIFNATLLRYIYSGEYVNFEDVINGILSLRHGTEKTSELILKGSYRREK